MRYKPARQLVNPTPHDTIAREGALSDGTLILDGRFRLKKLLGEGGMGLVYLAEQVSLGRAVAVKVLRDDLSLLAGMGERFRREALLLSSVDHAAVVRVIDFGVHGASACLVMEFVEGDTLEVALREGPMAPERALPLLLQLCQGLAAIHEKGIVHRDLKPENVVLTRSSSGGELARLLDFGIARLASPEAGSNVTQLGMVLGTPEVLSPEQAMGQQLDARSDIYSLGVVAYRMLSGVLPFPGPSPQEFVSQHISQPPRQLIDAAPQLASHEALIKLVMSCLEKMPDKRPQTAVALGTELARISLTLPSMSGPLLLSVTASGVQPAITAPQGHGFGPIDTDPSWAASGLPTGGIDAWAVEVQRKEKSFRRRLITASVVLTLLAAAVTFFVIWNEPARKSRRLITQGRGSEALQVIDDAGDAAKSGPLQMLKGVALHQVNRHDEELELMKAVPVDAPLELSSVDALCDDYGRKEATPLRKVLAGFSKSSALPVMQEIAVAELSKGQWGCLRFIDLEYAGQGLPLAELYVHALDSSDCRVRSVAAKRLGELRSPLALEPLRKLKDVPRKPTSVFANPDDCGQTAAGLAVRQLEKELQP